MRLRRYLTRERADDRGVSIVMIAVGMIFVLGMAGLGVDLASLYVGRTQAQRTADAAAIAAAQKLVSMGCTTASGPDISQSCIDAAKARAVAVGNVNLIAGVSPGMTTSDVNFLSTSINDPIVQVVAGRDTSHSNAMPTFFVKIFGIRSANVSASAKAEAYNPSSNGPLVGATCVKPWLLPNCDPSLAHETTSALGNPHCLDTTTGKYSAYFIDPSSGAIMNPGPVSSGGVQGEMITIKPGDPNGGATASPGKFWPVFLPAGSVASECPACASGGGGGGGSGSASLYRNNIECCNTNQIYCDPNGNITIQPITGNMVGPTEAGVDCLIHQGGSKGNPTGMDLMDPSTLQISAGSANPYGLSGPIDSSDSIVTIPVYDGTTLCPGSSCPSTTTVHVLGFIQLFIVSEDGSNQGNVTAYVMNVIGGSCMTGGGGGGGGGTPPVIAGGTSPIPIRLIQ